MAQRLDEIHRNMNGGHHNTGFNPSVSTHSAMASLNALNGLPNNPAPRTMQPQMTAEMYSHAASKLVNDFNNPEDVANANNFLFNLLLSAQAAGQGGQNINSLQAQQAHALLQSLGQSSGGNQAGGRHGLGNLLNNPLLGGGGGGGHQQHPSSQFMNAGRPPLPQFMPQPQPPPQTMEQSMDLLKELGINGMPGLDSTSLYANLQLQQQIQQQQFQLSQLLHQQQQMQQHSGGSALNPHAAPGGLYPTLPDQTDGGARSRSMSATSNRPIASLPTGSRLSASFSGSTSNGGQMFNSHSHGASPAGSGSGIAPPPLGHQTLLSTSDSGSSPSPSSASYHSSGYSSSRGDTPPSGAMDPFSTYTAFSPPSSHGLSPLSLHTSTTAANGAGGSGGADSPSLPNFTLEGMSNLSFDSLAKPHGQPVSSGLYPNDFLLGSNKAFKFMEPLNSGRPSPLSTSVLSEEPEEVDEDEKVLPSIAIGAPSMAGSRSASPEAVEMASSPSDVALKGRPFLSTTSSSSSSSSSGQSEMGPRSPVLPPGLEDVPVEYRLPSILHSVPASQGRLTLDARRSRSASQEDDAHYSSIRSTNVDSTSDEEDANVDATPPAGPSKDLPTLPSLASIYPSIQRDRGLGRPQRQASLTEEIVSKVDTMRLDAGSSSSSTAASTDDKPEALKEVENHVELIKGLLLAINRQYKASLAEDEEDEDELESETSSIGTAMGVEERPSMLAV